MWEPTLPLIAWPAKAIDLPGRGQHPADIATVTLDDCVESIVSDVDASGFTDIILVGQGLSCLAMPRVAAARPNVVRMVVLMPVIALSPGQGVLSTLSAGGTPTGGQAIILTPGRLKKGRPMVHTEEEMRRIGCSDMTKEQADWFVQRECPESPLLPSQAAAFPPLPASVEVVAIKLLQHVGFPVEQQELVEKNLPEGALVLILDSAGNPMISRPRETATLLNGLAVSIPAFAATAPVFAAASSDVN